MYEDYSHAPNRVKRLASSTQGLVQGVTAWRVLHERQRVLRVGKPETIAAAENSAGGVSNSLANQPPPGAPTPLSSAPPATQGIATAIRRG